MEFLAGMIVGSILNFAVVFGYKFYFRTEEKDKLLAESQGKEFEEKIRLKEKGK